MQLQEIEIFAGKFSTSAARQIFHQLFFFSRRFGDSIARRPNVWPGIQVFDRSSDLQAAKQISFTNLEIVSGIRFLSAARTKESLEISNLDGIFTAVVRTAKVLLKNALFSGLSGVVGGIAVLSMEIRIISRKFNRIGGNPPKSLDFRTRAGSFRSSAELLNFQREIRKLG
jgi:hypothetical protein